MTLLNFDPRDLDAIFRMLTPSDVAANMTMPYSARSNPTAARSTLEFVTNMVMNVDGRGAYLGKSMVSMVESWKSKSNDVSVDDFVQVYTTSSPSTSKKDSLVAWGSLSDYKKSLGASSSDSAPTTSLHQVMGVRNEDAKSGSDTSVILCGTPLVTPTVRDAHQIALFMNSVPTHVMSLAVPYLNVEFTFNRKPIEINGKFSPRAPNLLRFLTGARVGNDVDTETNKAIVGSLYDTTRYVVEGGQNKIEPFETTGVDVFCAPQSLANYDLIGPDRYNTILDPSRPFATLESLTFSTNPTFGYMTFKKGTLVFKVHDRSRLVDVADLIKPSEYGFASCWIQHGWSFPEQCDSSKGGMSYSSLINSMMTPKEEYGVKNSSISTDDSGQVTVTLELFTKSQMYARKYRVIAAGAADVYEKLNDAIQFVKDHREMLGLGPPAGMTKEIRIHQLLNAASGGGTIDMSKKEVSDAYRDLKNILNGSKKTKSDPEWQTVVQKFLDSVSNIAGSSDSGASKQTFKDRAGECTRKFIADKIKELTKSDPWLPRSSSDPFYDVVKQYVTVKSPNGKDPYVDSEKSKKSGGAGFSCHGVCSIAKLFSVFFLEPFRNIGHEVQIIFYTFNDSSGPYASNQNIGRFPIEIDVFADQFYRYLVNTSQDSLTIEEFMGFVANSILNDNFGLGYGLREFYEPYDGSTGHTLRENRNKLGKGAAASAKTYESVMSDFATSHGGPWKTPSVEAFIETVSTRSNDPKRESSDASANSVQIVGSVNDQVTRVHVYDKQANPYREIQAIVGPKDGGDFVFVRDISKFRKGPGAATSEQIDALQKFSEKKLLSIKPFDFDSNKGIASMSTNVTNKEYKDFVSQLVPTLVYGSNASGIINATLSSKADSLLSTANMIRQRRDPKNTVHPNGSGVGNLPVQVVPAMLSMTTFGCPKFVPAQVFFVDFNTGTSMDNLYILTSVNESISVGKYETNLQLAFVDGYAKFYSPTTMFEALQQEINWSKDPRTVEPAPGKKSKTNK